MATELNTLGKRNRTHLLEQFLRQCEIENKDFTKKDISDFSGYPVTTISTYIGKYLIGYLVHLNKQGKYFSKGIGKLSTAEFYANLSQKSSKIVEVGADPKVKKLRQRSLDSFCAAIENYNRVTLPNRVEIFCILMANAWELLLKAVVIELSGLASIFHKGTDRTLSLKDVAERCFNDNDPMLSNILEIAELRDQSIHLLIEELQAPLSRIFQASVLNYNSYYLEKVGKQALPKNTVGLLSLVYDSMDFENEIHIKDDHIAPQQVQKFLDNFSKMERNLKSEQYAIGIKRKLVLTNKDRDADITLSNQPDANSAIIIEKPRNREDTHPFRQTDAIKNINSKLTNRIIKLNRYTFQALIKKHKIKKNITFYAPGDFDTTGSYSQALLDKFINMINSNPQCIDKAKQHFQNSKQK